jgi:MFS family permease
VNTFGVFQDYYQDSLLKTHKSSDISWIGTFGAFLLVALSIISGPIFDRGYVRTLLVVGTFLTVFGLMMTSLSDQYWQLFLAQGVCVGLGGGFLFLPSVAIVATYFTTKRAFATGITAAGGSIGSVIYPIIFRKLQPQIGFAWTTRIIAFIALGTLSISIAVMKTRLPPPSKARAMVDSNALKSIPFVLFSLGLFLAFAGLYIPIFYIIVYAFRHANIDTDMSFYLLAILNAASVFGRIIPGFMADSFGSLNTIIGFTVGSAVIGYAWIGVHSLAGLVVVAMIYGFLSGAVVSLPATVIAGLVPEMQVMGTWMGMSFCCAAMGILIGSPIAGSVINLAEGHFSPALILSGSFTGAGGAIFTTVRALKYLESRKQKAVRSN